MANKNTVKPRKDDITVHVSIGEDGYSVFSINSSSIVEGNYDADNGNILSAVLRDVADAIDYDMTGKGKLN